MLVPNAPVSCAPWAPGDTWFSERLECRLWNMHEVLCMNGMSGNFQGEPSNACIFKSFPWADQILWRNAFWSLTWSARSLAARNLGGRKVGGVSGTSAFFMWLLLNPF